MSMSGASILIIHHVSLAFASLYFQWHATEVFERLFFAAFSLRLALSLLCTIATIKILNTANLFWEVTPSMLQISLILWLWGSGGICIGDRFFEDMFLWASIFKDQAEHITARRSRVPLFLVAELVMRPSVEGGQVWRSSSFLPALIIIYDNNTLPNGKILNERFRAFQNQTIFVWNEYILNHHGGSNLVTLQIEFSGVPFACCLCHNKLPIPTRDKFSKCTRRESPPYPVSFPVPKAVNWTHGFCLSSTWQMLVDHWLQVPRDREVAFLDLEGHIISISFHPLRNAKRDVLTVRPLGWEAVVWHLR